MEVNKNEKYAGNLIEYKTGKDVSQMNPHYQALGFYEIIEKLKDCALSAQAKSHFDALRPALREDACIHAMQETTAARKVLDTRGNPPLPAMTDLAELIALSQAGGMLIPSQLGKIAQFLNACRRMHAYLTKGESISPYIASYTQAIILLPTLEEELVNCLEGEILSDSASPQLKNIRRKKAHLEQQMKEKLSQVLRSNKQYLADNYSSNRNGHYVLPVQRRYQNQFPGTVIEFSAKGSTVFMEPSAISKLQSQYTALQLEEESEEQRILYQLTDLVAAHQFDLEKNMETLIFLDILFAKGKLGATMKANTVQIGGKREIKIRNGRHPLLPVETAVPLDFTMNPHTKGIIITGPNTGGKTVTLKTVGLLSLMAQCGLQIPCEEGSYIPMQDHYWCDIGDNQSISQNLSTFSGHITNVIDILARVTEDSLVLLDELGSGTDPGEGMGIAIAVLEELRHKGCMFLVTTHYPRVKTYAREAENILEARMAFDSETLQPLYRLEIGKSGESCALSIAKKLGLPSHLLEIAHQTVYGGNLQIAFAPEKATSGKSTLVRMTQQKKKQEIISPFQMGDSVSLLNSGETGIVYRPADEKGIVIVQVKEKKQEVNHTRLRLLVSADELYPPDYDFSILFDSVENRKTRKKMGKHHDPLAAIIHKKEGDFS